MNRSLVRRLWVGVLGLAAASLAEAQTIEIWAGGGTIRNSPGVDSPVIPLAAAVGPDGNVYVIDAANGRLVRLDTATGLATALPGLGPIPPWNFTPPEFKLWYGRSVAVDPSGALHVSTDTNLYQVDLTNGELIDLAGWSPPFGTSSHMAFDANGRLYFPMAGTHAIWLREPWGETRPVAGGAGAGFGGDGGEARWAQLDRPYGVAVDALGNLYIADANNHRVRRVDGATGIIDTVAGTGSPYFNGDGIPATAANIGSPHAVALDANGNLYIQDQDNSRIRRVDAATGLISTVAGNGELGYSGDGGPATAAAIDLVWGNIAVDAAGNLYLAEMGNNRLRRVDAATGLIETVLGNGTLKFCGESAPRRDACLGVPNGLTLDEEGDLLIADTNNKRIRHVDSLSSQLTTFAGTGNEWIEGGDGGPASQATFSDMRKLSRDAAGNLYIAGGSSNVVRRIDRATGIISTIAGTGLQGFAGDGGPALAARFSWVNHAVVGPDGNLYVSDSNNHRVRRISAATGIVTTIAGNGQSGGALGDGGQAVAASLAQPNALRFDAAGNLLIADAGHARIRRVDLQTGIISTVAGNGSWTRSGDGGPATSAGLGGPIEFTLDPAGNILVASGYALRRIHAGTGIISSVTPPWGLNTVEGVGLQYPTAMEFAPDGRLYVADADSDLVFRIEGLPYDVGDSTPPVVTPHVAGPTGDAGWYVGNVQVSWTIDDPESAVGETTGCGTTWVTADTDGTTFSCTATSVGGTRSASVTVRRDATPPELSFGAPSPAASATGWNTTDVSIPFTATDALSGIAAADASPVVFDGEGANLVKHVAVRDRAGNSVAVPTIPVNIDRTPPGVQPVIEGAAGNDGWYRGDVTVTWAIDEIAGSVQSTSGCDGSSVTSDTAGLTFTCAVTSAGGATSRSVVVKRDATPPTLTWRTASPLPNAAGWIRTNASFPFDAPVDALSGIASVSTASPLVVSAEGANVTGTVTVTDRAGNVAQFTSAPRNIDKTPPVISIPTPAAGMRYGLYSNVVADYSCTDAVSGATSCSGTRADGASLDTTSRNGNYTFRVTTADLAGNTASLTHAWSVAGSFNFEGFLAPTNNLPVINRVPRGSLVPLRWRLPDGQGGFVTNTAAFQMITVTTQGCSGTIVPLNDPASGPAGISFDPATAVFTYNWATSGSWTGCRKLYLRLRDGIERELLFQFQ